MRTHWDGEHQESTDYVYSWAKTLRNWSDNAVKELLKVRMTIPPADSSSDVKPVDEKTKWLATLSEFTKKLKGAQQRALILLIESNGSMPIADIATDKQVGWQKPYKGSVDGLKRALNEKLRPLNTSLKVWNNCLELVPKTTRKRAKKNGANAQQK